MGLSKAALAATLLVSTNAYPQTQVSASSDVRSDARAMMELIFFGGYFARVYETQYFPYFVGFCMAFGLAANIYWWRSSRAERQR